MVRCFEIKAVSRYFLHQAVTSSRKKNNLKIRKNEYIYLYFFSGFQIVYLSFLHEQKQQNLKLLTLHPPKIESSSVSWIYLTAEPATLQ